MDTAAIYRDKSPSLKSKATLALLHLAIVTLAVWILFWNGATTIEGIFGAGHTVAIPLRRAMLAAVAVLYFIRVLGTLFIFIKRRVPWSEVATIAVWVGMIDALIAYFGGRNPAGVGVWEAIGACLVIIGSATNTGSEWQRHAWKRNPDNKGHLYTGGLWKFARHINYFGDLVLFTGWVLMTGVPALLAIPVLMVFGFVFVNMPAQDRYLVERYGDEYRSYAGRTARLIPFLY